MTLRQLYDHIQFESIRPKLDAAGSQTRRAARNKPTLEIVREDDLLRYRQLAPAGRRVEGFAVRNTFQFEIFPRTTESALLPHHACDTVCPLAGGSILLSCLLAVFKPPQPLVQFLSNAPGHSNFQAWLPGRSSPRCDYTISSPPAPGQAKSSLPLNDNGSPVSQDFGHTVHEFRRVVTRRDDGVRAQLAGVLQHQLE